MDRNESQSWRQWWVCIYCPEASSGSYSSIVQWASFGGVCDASLSMCTSKVKVLPSFDLPCELRHYFPGFGKVLKILQPIQYLWNKSLFYSNFIYSTQIYFYSINHFSTQSKSWLILLPSKNLKRYNDIHNFIAFTLQKNRILMPVGSGNTCPHSWNTITISVYI